MGLAKGGVAPLQPSHGEFLVALTSFALMFGLVSLITVIRLKDAAIQISLHGGLLTPERLLATLGPIDALLALIWITTLLWLASLERRGRRLTHFMYSASRPQATVALVVLLTWLGHCYFSPGVLLGGDTGSHISRFLEVARGLNEGVLSGWTNYQYMGASLLWFTGPLLYILGGVATWLIGDAVIAAKTVLFMAHLASGLLFFTLLYMLKG